MSSDAVDAFLSVYTQQHFHIHIYIYIYIFYNDTFFVPCAFSCNFLFFKFGAV